MLVIKEVKDEEQKMAVVAEVLKKLEIFPQLWDLKNPCQILIKKIN